MKLESLQMPARALPTSDFVSRPIGAANGKRAPKRVAKVLAFAANGCEVTKISAGKLFGKIAERSPLPVGTLRAQLIPDSSWKRSTDVLGPAASQTVTRLARVLAFAARTWNSEADAIDWLLGTHMELGGATPYSLLRTESGGRAVENLMAALEYGFAL
ncbi:MAG TPA: antitoxin Xre/MbcA/ParS toxin-binding domain-containing protein [Acidobacteriaceae bacterium]